MTIIILSIALAMFILAAACRTGLHIPFRTIMHMARRHPMQTVVLAGLTCGFIAWGGTKGTMGITLDRVREDVDGVDFSWRADDARIIPGTVFVVQRRRSPFDGWSDIARTTATNVHAEGFTLDRDWTYRISAEVPE